jgi:hypothetical protein
VGVVIGICRRGACLAAALLGTFPASAIEGLSVIFNHSLGIRQAAGFQAGA